MLKNIIIVVLLIGNGIFTVDYLMKPPPPKHDGPRDEIIAMLHFDPTQVEKYDLLIQQHRKDIRSAERELMQAKNNLYKNLDQPLNDSLFQCVMDKESKIEKIHYAHFQDIKSLCTAKQMVYFRALNKKIATLFSHRMKPPKK